MKQIQTFVELLLLFEHIIFDNENDFIDQFCVSPSSVTELLSVYFCSDRIRFYYSDKGYITNTDEISFAEFESWVKLKMPIY
jgi:hypothetical protein